MGAESRPRGDPVKPKKKSKSLWIIAPLVIGAIAATVWWRSRTSTPTQAYREIQAERQTIALTILSTGGVKPETRVDIKPSIAGRAETVLIKEGDRVRKGQTLVWMSSTERAALIDAARAKGPEEEKKWEELYRPVPIVAPITGTIILRSIEPGQSFATTDAILAMSDRLTVQAQVDETDIAQVKPNQPAIIILDAYPNERIEGRVEKIAYEATTTNNVTNYNVVVIPLKTPDFMRSGMTANVTFEISKKEDVISVPTEAIKSREGKSFVTLPDLSRNPKAPPRDVEVALGMTDGKLTEVTSGLKEGETVLIPVATLNSAQSGTNPFMPSRSSRKR
ncbi:MAG: HlyD family efflux transporter periplasmic adaptor subunit [Proteobacteria bacterium]|nr:MAG: HlyD family efflux transporter periplasmic adaptor subunit [Pseudomonadota bacterium]